MNSPFYCVMLSGRSLTYGMADILFLAAQTMFKNGCEKKYFSSDIMEGLLTTSFDSGCLGSVSGYKFQAEVETDHGRSKVVFLARPADLEHYEDYEWHSFSLADNPFPPKMEVGEAGLGHRN